MADISIFDSIIDKYRVEENSKRELGTKFERLIQAYFNTDPMYAHLLDNVWLFDEFPSRADLGGNDTGIDLVAQTISGEYWAIQCKCYAKDHHISKSDLDTFLSTSSKTFSVDEQPVKVGFSRRFFISTTDKWGKTAENTIHNQNPPVTRLSLTDLRNSSVDWEKLDKGLTGEKAVVEKKALRDYQETAVNNANKHFKEYGRGKLIMACGTGKTFTSLKLTENETGGNGLVLFLIPSIALLAQTLREWSNNSDYDIYPICICSDPKSTKSKTKNDDGGYEEVDLALPASTDPKKIVAQLETGLNRSEGLTVVFSTYQSIEVVSKAQKEFLKGNNTNHSGEFDIIVCDEAHRTTGARLTKEDEAAFTKVHDEKFILAKRRLYMTATPRLYKEEVKAKAAEEDIFLCSMDDESIYGKEIFRIDFGEAVSRNLLSDYKVLILTVDDTNVPKAVQKLIANKDEALNADDASKLIGCINALSKKILGDAGLIKDSDPNPMRKAVAFTQNINVSKHITKYFNELDDVYSGDLEGEEQEGLVNVSSDHIDGSMSAPEREEKLNWLTGSKDDKECRILTNVRCLSEGVDVPSLDAVMFLSAKNSQVEVVQSVGRVMRRAEGKKYGYIIIPLVVPASIEPSKMFDNNKEYKVVWDILNALRSHDERFNAEVNKIELNNALPKNIVCGSIGGADHNGNDDSEENLSKQKEKQQAIEQQAVLQFEEMQSAFYAKMVQKVGNRRYWENWAKDVALIATKHIERITRLVDESKKHSNYFEKFLKGLQTNINPAVTKEEAIEMLSQHIITKPVFEALFEDYSFVKSNPVSESMQKMLELLEAQALEKDTEVLQKFYDSVRMRADGIDNAEGKQKIIIELYDKFFRSAFPRMVEKLGIVYTPTEVVDFIIHSVDDVLKKEFNRGLTGENVHILDPFTGTGTFITRLLQSGLIDEKDLARKYKGEIHANEIVLLAYYIASINIENVYHDITDSEGYEGFEGICLTDTFQLGEDSENEDFIKSGELMQHNTKRVQKQKKAPLRVIIGNPPYSVGQKSANDNAQNQSYTKLDNRLENTYVKETSATLKNALYDSYVKAFRWSSDRLDDTGGVISFVSNGSWLDNNGFDGFRKCIEEEFSSIYVFNLRGNARTQGEQRKQESGNVFGSGSRTPVAITLLVKNPNSKSKRAKIHYRDIGDYLTQREKLDIVKEATSFLSKDIKLSTLKPNKHNDWLNQRNDNFYEYDKIEADKKYNSSAKSYFVINSLGISVNRDAWCYNSCKDALKSNIQKTIEFYNKQVDSYDNISDVKAYINRDDKYISWSDLLLRLLKNNITLKYEGSNIKSSIYRPFFKQNLYYSNELNERLGQSKQFFPTPEHENIVICISGLGAGKKFSALITNLIPNRHFVDSSQCFPLYWYEEVGSDADNLFDKAGEKSYKRHDGITDYILNQAHEKYNSKVTTKEDIFYYIYGILHSEAYKAEFAANLKKDLPRIPLVDNVKDFRAFSKAGRKLAELHLNYETVPPCDKVVVTGDETENYTVTKMKFLKKDRKDTIIYNSHIKLENIPPKAYKYVVNGRSAIEWLLDRYQVKTDKKSGITNDPNDWATEVGNPRYILDLMLSIINLSLKTVDIVDSLPTIKFD